MCEEAGAATPPSPVDAFEAGTWLAPEAVPRPLEDLLHNHGEGLGLSRLGRQERTPWGVRATLRGIEALRGYCVSETPMVDLQIRLDGEMLYRGVPEGGYALGNERNNHALRKYVFNAWVDLSAVATGPHEIEFMLIDGSERPISRRETIIVAPALALAEHGASDGVVPPIAPGAGTLDAYINGLPSMVRAGRRALFDTPPQSVLVQRLDQLGDLVISVPALRRLREILPEARIVGLLTPANAELAATLGLFDEIVTVDFADDWQQRRRVMPLDAQEELRLKLESYRFDLAIDLSENGSSRPLLALSGARHRFGFPSGEMPLDMEVAGFTHDRWNGLEVLPHTSKLVALVEWLGVALKGHQRTQRRDDLVRSRLVPLGIAENDRFAVLHDGARLSFSRWPHYSALAAMLLEQTDHKVVLVSDGEEAGASLPSELRSSDRFVLIEGRLPLDDLDALLSFCSLFVGNDSGPKHLAALRGAKVVSIHMARNNWNEWGQETGYVVSRRVPCAGCLIWHNPEDCGKGFACIRQIEPSEVLSAALKLLED